MECNEYIERLNCNDEKEAEEFIRLYNDRLEKFKNEHYGFVGANFKPFPIAYPKLSEKYAQARVTLKLNYWQMSFKEAQKIHRGLPKKNWEKSRNLYL